MTCCPWSHGLRPKKLSVSEAVPPAPVRVPSQRPLAPNVASVTSVANDKGLRFFFPSWSHRLRRKKVHASVAVPAVPVLVPSQRPLAPNVTSVANDKDDNEIIPETVHRSPGICLTTEENPGKLHLENRWMKGLCDQLSPQMGSLSSK